MATDPKNNSTKPLGGRGRSLSRQILGQDMDLVNKYASKYSTSSNNPNLKRTSTYTSIPAKYGGYSGYTSSYNAANAYGQPINSPSPYPNNSNHNINYSKYQNNIGHGYGSGSSGSSTSSYSSNTSSKKRKNRRTPSNLISSTNTNNWDQNAVNTQQQDMSSAMNNMISNYQTRITQQASFLDDIQSSVDNDPNFAKIERAEDWSVKEVCYWLTTIHLDKYIKAFSDQIIDGSILLRDLDTQMLTAELGIKRLHVKKLLREIKKLKDASPKMKKEKNDKRDQLIEQLRKEIEKLKEKNKTLHDENIRLKSTHSSGYSGNMNKYTNVNYSAYK